MPSSDYITFTNLCIAYRYFQSPRQNYTIVLSSDRDLIVYKTKKLHCLDFYREYYQDLSILAKL